MFSLPTIRERVATGAAVTALALSVALGLAGPAVPSAHAEPNGQGGGVICKWDGKEYSEGGRVVSTDSDGITHTYECQSDGKWHVIKLVAGGTRFNIATTQHLFLSR